MKDDNENLNDTMKKDASKEGMSRKSENESRQVK
jgi:hypothetical protein